MSSELMPELYRVGKEKIQLTLQGQLSQFSGEIKSSPVSQFCSLMPSLRKVFPADLNRTNSVYYKPIVKIEKFLHLPLHLS